ncbi:MAG: hypothetical protein KAQ96_01385, partial [Thermoplasmata archaeon]|nr:hypothetical protein [Thermoplasmata archaeon]
MTATALVWLMVTSALFGLALVSDEADAEYVGTWVNVTDDHNYQDYPATYGDIVVWGDSKAGYRHTYMKDMSTGTETQISSGNHYNYYPDIYDDKIVWQSRQWSSYYQIAMYDIDTGTTTRISPVSASQETPSIHDNRVVWMDSRNGNWDIYM